MAGRKMQVALFLVVCVAAAGRCCLADESWSDWVSNKFNEGAEKARNLAEKPIMETMVQGETRVQGEERPAVMTMSQSTEHKAINMAEKVAETTKSAAEAVNSAADGTTQFASQAVDNAKTKVQGTYTAAKDTLTPEHGN